MLIQAGAFSSFFLGLQHIAQLSAVQLPAQLQKFLYRNIDVNVVGLAGAGRAAEVIGGKSEMDSSDPKRIIEAFDKQFRASLRMI